MRAASKPRELGDLPFARHLEPAGSIDISGEYDCAHFDGLTLDQTDAVGTHFTECALSGLTVTGGSFRHARFNDAWVQGSQWTGVDLSDTSWLDTEFVLDALSGVEAFGANLRRVRFHNCKFDSVNLRGAVLNEVSFVDCVLRHVDISEAKLTSVTFPGTQIDALSLRKAQLKKVDFREARVLGVYAGIESLAGATITQTQLLELAPVFAHTFGIEVR
ncbi:pentapeptide repeat-containing protein [Nocardia yamanashiensis]|uniref:pentapeptide repeat-containing protein n=1 Tax=Nocardia yamanashiensis TaxID=209247 RepID=UPI00083661DD|nr:pentapeptide repeat-containing protein [Nocardia yamanashiensis]